MILLFRDAALQSADIALLIAVIAMLAVAVMIELPTRRIPNWLVVATLALGVAIMFYDQRFGAHLAGLLVAVLIGVPFYIHGSAAGGPVKLLFGIGLLAGVMAVLGATLVAIITFGVYRLLQKPDDAEDENRPRAPKLIHSTPLLGIGVLLGLLLPLAFR